MSEWLFSKSFISGRISDIMSDWHRRHRKNNRMNKSNLKILFTQIKIGIYRTSSLRLGSKLRLKNFDWIFFQSNSNLRWTNQKLRIHTATKTLLCVKHALIKCHKAARASNKHKIDHSFKNIQKIFIKSWIFVNHLDYSVL